jgi:GAF domain-containing protein
MHGYGACWAQPILSHDGSALGGLTLFLRTPHEPTSDEGQAIAMATRISGIAIERSQAEQCIRHMANHDALTGLPNLMPQLQNMGVHLSIDNFGTGYPA